MISTAQEVQQEVFKLLNVAAVKDLLGSGRRIFPHILKPDNAPNPSLTISASMETQQGEEALYDQYLLRVLIHLDSNVNRTVQGKLLSAIKREIATRIENKTVTSTLWSGRLAIKDHPQAQLNGEGQPDALNSGETTTIFQLRALAFA